jgi:hypothetical protein
VGSGPLGIAFDGANMWIANRGDGTVSKLRASDGKTLGTFQAPVAPYGVAFDGTNIWVSGAPALVELGASNGALLGAWNKGPGTGIAFDGANIWQARFSYNTVYKF